MAVHAAARSSKQARAHCLRRPTANGASGRSGVSAAGIAGAGSASERERSSWTRATAERLARATSGRRRVATRVRAARSIATCPNGARGLHARQIAARASSCARGMSSRPRSRAATDANSASSRPGAALARVAPVTATGLASGTRGRSGRLASRPSSAASGTGGAPGTWRTPRRASGAAALRSPSRRFSRRPHAQALATRGLVSTPSGTIGVLGTSAVSLAARAAFGRGAGCSGSRRTSVGSPQRARAGSTRTATRRSLARRRGPSSSRIASSAAGPPGNLRNARPLATASRGGPGPSSGTAPTEAGLVRARPPRSRGATPAPARRTPRAARAGHPWTASSSSGRCGPSAAQSAAPGTRPAAASLRSRRSSEAWLARTHWRRSASATRASLVWIGAWIASSRTGRSGPDATR
mmetsp:Transcript_81482/g.205048  ORF Transcript_81482/g.205048 Transcript_81482/m.205048 type:complete len:412 (-) Transcript_81482:128-1363(-)